MAAKLILRGNDDFTAKILSWYIWGQPTAPSKEKIADTQWIDREGNITLEVEAQEFLEKAGNFVNAKDFRLFETFFSGKTVSGNKLNNGNPTLNEGQYERFDNGLYFLTQEQFAELFYREYKDNDELDEDGKPKSYTYDIAKEPTLNKHPAGISLYNRNLDNPDFAKLAFAFGSMDVGLNTSKIRYVLDENLNPSHVRDVEYQFEAGDFDFVGGKGSGFVNQILNQIADPSGIGKRINLKFTGDNKIDGGSINKSNYDSMKELKEYKVGSKGKIFDSDFYKAMGLFEEEYNRIKSSGVINYLDENGKLVMYGSNDDDRLVEFQAKNINFSEPLLSELADVKNHYKQYVKNGITYVGGKGSDTIVGSEYDDILYSNDKNNTDDKVEDKLSGSKGFDTYYVGDKDVIFDSDGKGKVVFEGVELKGGTYDKGKGVYVSNDRSVEYKLSGDNLTVSKGGKFLTINSFTNSQKDPHLGIYLLKNDDKPSPNKNPEEQGDLLGDQGGLFPTSNPIFGARYIVVTTWPDGYSYTRDYLPWERIETDDLPMGARIQIITSMPGGSFHTRDYDVTEQAKAAWRNKNSAPAKTNDANLEKNRDDASSGKNTSNASGSVPGDSTSTAGTNAGNDKIYGGKGDDVITGGAGDDTIYGEEGADTFKFNPGDGNDLIYADNNDVIELGEGISKDDIEFKVAGASFESLRIELKNTKEGIIAHDALNNEKAAFKKVKFADGTSLSFKEIVSGLNLQKLLNGSEANDEIVGTKFSDTVYAKGGNDKISTKEGNDYIYAADGDDEIDGGAGDDLIFGGKGNDVITGGAGDDTIYGEEGADTFKFNPEDGNDTLYTDSSDKLILNAVKAGDVKFKYENNHLRVSYSQNDSALLINYALNQSNQIKGIELDDGSYITSKKINETMQKISEYLKENQASENDPQIKNIMMSGWSQGGDDGWSL